MVEEASGLSGGFHILPCSSGVWREGLLERRTSGYTSPTRILGVSERNKSMTSPTGQSMGRKPTGMREYTLTNPQPIHREIVRRLVRGQKHKDIARDLNISPVTVSMTANSPIMKPVMEELSRDRDKKFTDVDEELKRLQPKALERIEAALHDKNLEHKEAVKVAFNVLDHSGYSPVKRVQGHLSHGHFTFDDIQKIKNRAKQVGVEVLADHSENGDEPEDAEEVIVEEDVAEALEGM